MTNVCDLATGNYVTDVNSKLNWFMIIGTLHTKATAEVTSCVWVNVCVATWAFLHVETCLLNTNHSVLCGGYHRCAVH